MRSAHRFAVLMATLLVCSIAYGVAGSDRIATPGRPTTVSKSLPRGTAEFVNLPSRTEGWNDWFSEWPNDVNHYLYGADDTAEINALIEQFAKIESARLQIRLAPLPEPRGLGWTTSLKKGNGAAAVFSIGDQAILDRWYEQLDGGKFGVMEFTGKPIAAPPTLTLFVDHKAIDLGVLKIPPRISVAAGYLPTVSEMPIKRPPVPEKSADTKSDKPAPPVAPADPAIEAATKRIATYLDARPKPDATTQEK
jgi:hypothetical protein